ncbi:MAG: DUF6429 family protein [Proteobacteria bacterium]|nr:DUF6429 family protein [Pseudomonadota bacterium]
MEYNKDKVDKMVLALMYLSTFKDQFGLRVWKGLDWDALDRLHERGYISDPKSKSKSVTITEEAFM